MLTENLKPYASAVASAEDHIRRQRIVARIWEKDHTVWSTDSQDIATRMGRLDTPSTMRNEVPRLRVGLVPPALLGVDLEGVLEGRRRQLLMGLQKACGLASSFSEGQATPLGFGTLKQAQAGGDSQALRRAGRHVLRLHIRGEASTALNELMQIPRGPTAHSVLSRCRIRVYLRNRSEITLR